MPTSVSKEWWVSACALLCLVLLVYMHKPTPIEKPNVMIIMIDTLRADHMGVYGYERNTTPFLDSLFKQGVVFEHAYAPAYLTFQTDASVLTGLYPSQHNMRTWSTPINSSVTMLPAVFGLYGYQSAAFVSPSLWHYFGLPASFGSYTLSEDKNNIAVSKDAVAGWVAATTTPQFTFWHVYDLHEPYLAPSAEFYSGDYAGPYIDGQRIRWADQAANSISYRTHDGIGEQPVQPEDVTYVRAAYDTSLRYVDDQLRTFFAALKRSGEYRNTIFVISSEHGEDLNEHGFMFHRDIYDVVTHVPLAIIYPGHLAPRRVEIPVSLVDITSTVSALAGLPTMEGEGLDLGPALNGHELPQRDLYIERAPFDDYAVISWPWKYILRSPLGTIEGMSDSDANIFFTSIRRHDVQTGDELYNLADDPGEQRNLIDTGVSVESGLRAKAEKYRLRMRAARLQNEQPIDVDREKLLYTYP